MLMAVLNVCAELHEWDFRTVERTMDARDLTGVWLPYFRLRQKEIDKSSQNDEATAARQRAEARLMKEPP